MNKRLPFIDYLFKERRNRDWIIFAAIVGIIQFFMFKYFYPFASYIHGDSFVYIETAFNNLQINTYLIGYSMFLRAFSVFSSSDTALVFLQYLLINVSILFFLFSLFYFVEVGKYVRFTLLIFTVFNPLAICLANLISSDGIFLALSFTWVSSLIWLIVQLKWRTIIIHGVLLFLCFTVRYNSLVYFPLSILALSFANGPLTRKIIGIAMPLTLSLIFIFHTGSLYKSLTGTWQYSPFSGWLLANNAMYAYKYVDKRDIAPVPAKFLRLDQQIRYYFDTTRDTNKYQYEKIMAGTFYMWSPHLPLFEYRDQIFKRDSTASELKKWAAMGPFYKDYGEFIIARYPIHFLAYFIWPNVNKYYAPPVEYLENYNSGKDSVNRIAAAWFKYRGRRVYTRTKNLTMGLLDFYPILSGMSNSIMIVILIIFTTSGGWNSSSLFTKFIALGSAAWLINAIFSIVASSVALRFQAFPILLSIIINALLINWIENNK
jgi:hypothetical protein